MNNNLLLLYILIICLRFKWSMIILLLLNKQDTLAFIILQFDIWKSMGFIIMIYINGICNPYDDLTTPLGYILHANHFWQIMCHYLLIFTSFIVIWLFCHSSWTLMLVLLFQKIFSYDWLLSSHAFLVVAGHIESQGVQLLGAVWPEYWHML